MKDLGLLSCGAVEGLNLKAKLTIRKAYRFKSSEFLKKCYISGACKAA